jgi:hypothetical protein
VAFMLQEEGCIFVDISNPLTFSDVFAKLRKVTINIVMSVRPSFRLSVGMQKLGFHWSDFPEIWHLGIFRKTLKKIQVALKSDRNNGTSHKEQYTHMITSHSHLFRMRNVSDKSCRKYQNTHFMTHKVFFFFKENPAVCECGKILSSRACHI